MCAPHIFFSRRLIYLLRRKFLIGVSGVNAALSAIWYLWYFNYDITVLPEICNEFICVCDSVCVSMYTVFDLISEQSA